jgi:predicted transcriptional regulator
MTTSPDPVLALADLLWQPFPFRLAVLTVRARYRLTQADLAEVLHVSTKTISKWETGDDCGFKSTLRAMWASDPRQALIAQEIWRLST